MLTAKVDEKQKLDGVIDLRPEERSISKIDVPGKGSPTELLAEFLYSVMIKDYEKALKLCTQILQFEPNNLTAQEFYPLIAEKLERIKNKELEYSSSESSGTFSPGSSSSSENGIYLKRRSNSEKKTSYLSHDNDNDNESNDSSDSNPTALYKETTKGNTENLDFNLTLPKQSPSIKKKNHLISPTPTEIIKATKSRNTIPLSSTLLVCSTKTKILTDKNAVAKTTAVKEEKLQNQISSNVLRTTATITFPTKSSAQNKLNKKS